MNLASRSRLAVSLTRITNLLAVFAFCAASGSLALAQAPTPASGKTAPATIHAGKASVQSPAAPSEATAQSQAAPPAKKKPDTLITPAQARELFASIDQIMQFDSRDSGIPIKHPIKRQLTTRAAVQKYLESQMTTDKSAQRMLRSAIVLKKFGLLPRNFNLGPFMVKLLKEQIAGYYDPKTKTVYLLNWVDPDIQKPVMAHELMHALQDQHVNLTKWSDISPEGISHNVVEDNRHIRLDEDDTARHAVLEGQAQVTFVDYALAPHHMSIASNPNRILSHLSDLMNSSDQSPIMAGAPRVLRESLVFPYDAGLRFEITLLRDEGKQGAFADALDNPPSSSYQIMTPSAYEQHLPVPVLVLPNIHPLLDHQYKPYDIGVMGELDAKMLLQLTTGDDAAGKIAAQWDGGTYYVSQTKHTANLHSTASVALLYLSRWKTAAAAHLFARNYETEVNNKYLHAELASASTATDRVYSTSEGPVLISTTGRYVFVSESYPLDLARKLEAMLLNAQSTQPGEETAANHPACSDLTGGLRSFIQQAGFLRVELPIAHRVVQIENHH